MCWVRPTMLSLWWVTTNLAKAWSYNAVQSSLALIHSTDSSADKINLCGGQSKPANDRKPMKPHSL